MTGDHGDAAGNLPLVDELLERRLQLSERLRREPDLGRLGLRQFARTDGTERDEDQKDGG